MEIDNMEINNMEDISDILNNRTEGNFVTTFVFLPVVGSVVTVIIFIFFCCCKKVGRPGIPLKFTVIIKFSFSDATLPPTINAKNES